jgi:hypothetical protein
MLRRRSPEDNGGRIPSAPEILKYSTDSRKYISVAGPGIERVRERERGRERERERERERDEREREGNFPDATTKGAAASGNSPSGPLRDPSSVSEW